VIHVLTFLTSTKIPSDLIPYYILTHKATFYSTWLLILCNIKARSLVDNL